MAATRTHTHTYTRFFGSEDVDKLGEAFKALEVDYLSRKDHVPPKIAKAMEARLENLRWAWYLLYDIVPDDLY